MVRQYLKQTLLKKEIHLLNLNKKTKQYLQQIF